MVQMMDIRKLVEKIEDEEGYREKIYLCPAGKWTIGAGINLEAEAIPKDLADEWLKRIVLKRLSVLHGYDWFNSLDENRQIAVADMAYQMGVSGLLRFQKMIQAILEADYDTAAREMLDSKWARQVKDRAQRLAKMVRTGEWPE